MVGKPRWPVKKLPRHIAFIMDGNGRWARRRSLLRLRGHEEGAGSLRKITTYCRELGVRETTFFALSTENYLRRPREEVRCLMGLLEKFLIDERPTLTENGIRLTTIGDTSTFPDGVRAALAETLELTEEYDGMVLRLALNYGSRQEILDGIRRVAREVAEGRLSLEEVERFEEGDFARFLADPQMTDPDLLIRTAGEMRLSNFLLWQASYSELWVTERLWPEFDTDELDRAIDAYIERVRKYGAVQPPEAASRKSFSGR